MSDLIIFIIGTGVTSVVGCAVALLVWGASQERYVSGRHVGGDLLKSADEGLRTSEPARPSVVVLPGGQRRSKRAVASSGSR